MGYVIGETAGLSTWGKCRSLAGQEYYDVDGGGYKARRIPDFYSQHAVYYESHEEVPWLKTTKGSGLVRTGFVNPDTIPPWFGSQFWPYFSFGFPYGPDFTLVDFAAVFTRDKAQQALLGADVYSGAAVFQIQEEAFVHELPRNGQQLPSSFAGSINQVGDVFTPV
jgi:hypothetical protein